MTWIKQSDELYINDQTFFSLEKIDGIWYVINNKDNFKSIPFTDIFNNPVFPIDLSNVDLIVKSLVSSGAISGNSLDITNTATAKHFRGEAANTPATPALSFQTDLDTGLYRISDNVVGFSANGARQGEFGVGYGGFTGNIIQVVSTAKTDTSTFSTTFGTISGLSQSITPKYSNSKILILINISTGRSADNVLYFKILRGSTDIYVGDLAGSRTLASSTNYMSSSYPAVQSSSITLIFLDSPATTSLITYDTQARADAGSGFINRTGTDTDSAFYSRNSSSITLMEVQQ